MQGDGQCAAPRGLSKPPEMHRFLIIRGIWVAGLVELMDRVPYWGNAESMYLFMHLHFAGFKVSHICVDMLFDLSREQVEAQYVRNTHAEDHQIDQSRGHWWQS